MADSTRETALKGLLAVVVAALPSATVKRNAPEPERIPDNGLAIVRDGEPGEPDVLLSPPTYSWEHEAEVVVFVQDRDEPTRSSALDAMLQAIGAAIEADDTLGGKVDRATVGAADMADDHIEGAETIKSAQLVIILEYDTSTPLG